MKKCKFLLMLLLAVTFNSCSNANTKPTVTNVQAELDKAKKAGKVVFVVVTGTGAVDVDKATAIAKSANAKYKNSVVIEMDRDNASNANLSSQWRLGGAPLPLILVISSKGIPVGGYILSEATAEKLIDLIPTQKMDEVYSAVNSGKSVFLVVSKKSYTDKAKIIENCKSAVVQLQNKAVIIEIDLSDAKEANFIKQLNLKNTPNTTTVIVFNNAGKNTGVFEGVVETNQLVSAASKVVKSCCPSGSGSGCGKK